MEDRVVEDGEPGGSASKSPSRALLVALPITALVVVIVLWSLTTGDSPPPAPQKPSDSTPTSKAPDGDPSLAAIAVQQADLPEPSVRCSFSGDMDTYIRNLREARAPAFESVDQTWTQLKAKGAVAGYVAWWGDVQSTCDSVVASSNEMNHTPGAAHPTTTFSFVVRYRDAETAGATYKSDIFGQSKLKQTPSFEVTDGVDTGLGDNAAVAVAPKAPIPLHQAIWQNSTITVYYGSENIPLDKSKQITDSINRRIS